MGNLGQRASAWEQGLLSPLRAASAADAARLAQLHIEGITEGFLPTLGIRFLRRLYRRAALSSSAFVVVMERTGSSPGGFVAGALETRRLYREFLRLDGPAVALACAPRLIAALPGVVETLRYSTSDAPVDEPELLALAVTPEERRKGWGSALTSAFLGAVAGLGAGSARVVVGSTNRAAIELYGGAGFEPIRQLEVHRGHPSLLMRAALRTGSA